MRGQFARELAHGLEHRVPVSSTTNETLVHERCKNIDVRVAHSLGRFECEPADENCQAGEKPLLLLLEQIEAPRKGLSQRALAFRQVPSTAAQEFEPLPQPRQHRFRRESRDSCCGKLDRKRKAVELVADRSHRGDVVGRQFEVVLHRLGPLAKQRHRVRRRQRRHGVDVLACEAKWLAARRDHLQTVRLGKQFGQP